MTARDYINRIRIKSLLCRKVKYYELRRKSGYNPAIMLGKPVIKGTRITVEAILRKLSEGVSVEQLLTSYPHLSKEDIFAALTYASDLIANEEMIFPHAS